MIKGVVSDMDGVIYRGGKIIDGAQDFVNRMHQDSIPFLFLTNNSEQTPIDLKLKLEKLGIRGVEEKNFITSAMATAMFLSRQKPHSTVYVVGGGGLINELYNVGFSISEHAPDYVVVGKTQNFSYEMMKTAVRLIRGGAKFIGTNPDMIDPTADGFEPACGAILAGIESACGQKPYIVGKPNSLMMALATQKLGLHTSDTLMVGDRMDTDILGGMEAGMNTALVLSGVTHRDDLPMYPYSPDMVFASVAELYPDSL